MQDTFHWQEGKVSCKVSIRSVSERLELTDSDWERSQRRLASSLSRYSDRLLSVDLSIDLTNLPDGAHEYRCDLEGNIGAGRPILVTTRGDSLQETVSRAADRAARSIDRTLLESSIS